MKQVNIESKVQNIVEEEEEDFTKNEYDEKSVLAIQVAFRSRKSKQNEPKSISKKMYTEKLRALGDFVYKAYDIEDYHDDDSVELDKRSKVEL